MPFYEIMCIARSAAPIASCKSLISNTVRTVKESGGVVRSFEHFGVMAMAYRMRAHNKWNTDGRYMRIKCEVNPQTLFRIESDLKNNENIIRWLTIKNHESAPRRPILTSQTTDALANINDSEMQQARERLFHYLKKFDTIIGKQIRANVNSLPVWQQLQQLSIADEQSEDSIEIETLQKRLQFLENNVQALEGQISGETIVEEKAPSNIEQQQQQRPQRQQQQRQQRQQSQRTSPRQNNQSTSRSSQPQQRQQQQQQQQKKQSQTQPGTHNSNNDSGDKK